MKLYEYVGVGIFLLFMIPTCLYVLLLQWNPDGAGNTAGENADIPGRPNPSKWSIWWPLLVGKLIVLGILAFCAWLVCWMAGLRLPVMFIGARIMSSVLLVALVAAIVYTAGQIISSHREFRSWARGPDSNPEFGEDLTSNPADSFKQMLLMPVLRGALRLRFGWLLIVSLAGVMVTVAVIGLMKLWIRWGWPGIHLHGHAWSLYEHATCYICWGGALVVAVIRIITRKGDLSRMVSLAVVSAAYLVLYVVSEGLWR
jgi:hypothetical protein